MLVAAFFQIAVLLGMIFLNAAPLFLGKTILVRVVPMDPRDMFRGDYVILGYEFSRDIGLLSIEGIPPNLTYSEKK